jgi:outer membrane lipoprotein-sorting protein
MERLCASILVLVLAGVACAEETLDQVYARLAEARKAVTSMSYEVEGTMVADNKGNLSISTSIGSVELLRKGDKWLVRIEDKLVSSRKPGNVEVRGETTTVYDGEMLYSYSFMAIDGGMKSCSKMKVPERWSDAYDERADFEKLKAHHELKLLPDDFSNDVPVYVIEAKRKIAPFVVYRHYYSKQTGVWMGSTAKSADGNASEKISRKNVKINPELPAERFIFTPPPGVTVEDRTEELKKALNRK